MKIEIHDDDIHDFTKGNLRWGWNGLDFSITEESTGRQTAKMLGIGKGIKKGEHVLLSFGDEKTCWGIEAIDYETNPSDMFRASLSFIGIEDC